MNQPLDPPQTLPPTNGPNHDSDGMVRMVKSFELRCVTLFGVIMLVVHMVALLIVTIKSLWGAF